MNENRRKLLLPIGLVIAGLCLWLDVRRLPRAAGVDEFAEEPGLDSGRLVARRDASAGTSPRPPGA